MTGLTMTGLRRGPAQDARFSCDQNPAPPIPAFLLQSGWPRFGSVRLRFGDGTVRVVPVFGSGGSSKEGVLDNVFFSTASQRGRFRFRFRFLENGSGGSGSAFGSCENGSGGSGFRFRFGSCATLFNAHSSTPTPVFLPSREETQTMVRPRKTRTKTQTTPNSVFTGQRRNSDHGLSFWEGKLRPWSEFRVFLG